MTTFSPSPCNNSLAISAAIVHRIRSLSSTSVSLFRRNRGRRDDNKTGGVGDGGGGGGGGFGGRGRCGVGGFRGGVTLPLRRPVTRQLILVVG